MFMSLASKILLGFVIGIPYWFIGCIKSNKILSSKNKTNMEMQPPITSFYDLDATSIDGDVISMSAYKGKKILVLNVASKCGYTPQYALWEEYYRAHQDELVILGFPCNQFLSQEPGSVAEIKAFCSLNYGVSFPLFDKIDVKGTGQHPIYKWLSDPLQNGWNSEVPSWNFCKYLIDENGQLTHYFASAVTPDNPLFLDAVK